MACLRLLPGWSPGAAVVAALVAGCDGVQPDVVPPRAVTDLAVDAVSESTVTLTWTAPENDGKHLRVEAYDVRLSPGGSPSSWDAGGTRVSFPDRPQPPGETETLEVPGLAREQEYAFAVRSADRSGNWSPWSNAIQGQPADDEPPGPIEDLRVEVLSATRVRLRWTATGDDGGEGAASVYRVRTALGPITAETWPDATPVEAPLQPAAAGSPEVLEVDGLTPATDYWFGVRAVDDGGSESPWRESVNGPTPRVPRTWVVTPDGSGDRETVQAGIDAAIKGDTVLVRPGRYYEDIDFLGKDIVVRSLEGPETTILDGSREDSSVVIFKRGETRAAVLEGFTITGGKGTLDEAGDYRDGGGVWCAGPSPTIRGNHIVDNHLDDIYGWGGGLLVWSRGEAPLVDGNVIAGNSSKSNGGGMGIYSSIEVSGNVFVANTSGADGGAMHIYLAHDTIGSVYVLDNEFFENTAWDHGGALEAHHGANGGPFFIEGNLFVRNEARGKDYKLEAGGGVSARGMKGRVAENTFVGNSGGGAERCGGGAILLDNLENGIVAVERNIIAASQGCGVRCPEHLRMIPPSVSGNIFWGNSPYEVAGDADCIGNWMQNNSVADPLFCEPDADDYRLASDSPVFQREEVIGAFPEPGCGPLPGSQLSQ